MSAIMNDWNRQVAAALRRVSAPRREKWFLITVALVILCAALVLVFQP